MSSLSHYRIFLPSGLALFAMFFGAGNLIYPLALGANAEGHIFYIMAAFFISGIGLPFLGLFATSLYQGDYWIFFNRLGKIPAFILISFLILTIGPLFAVPRTELITYHTIQAFLPAYLDNNYFFSAIYCSIIFILIHYNTSIVDIIGRFLSPIKLCIFFVLIIAGLSGTHDIVSKDNTIWSSISLGLLEGYNTMDLLAAFFFCTLVCNDILIKAKVKNISSNETIIKLFFLSYIVGGLILGLVYVGFMLVAYFNSVQLQGVATAHMITAVSHLVLGKFGSLFVAVCVTFSCLVTAIALTSVTTNFIYDHIVKAGVPKIICLIFSIIFIYCMSIIGFTNIMKLISPLLQVLYPALIVYCMINICCKLKKFDAVYYLDKKKMSDLSV